MRPGLVTLPFTSLAESSAGTWQLGTHQLSSPSSSPSLSSPLISVSPLFSLPPFSFYPLPSLLPLFSASSPSFSSLCSPSSLLPTSSIPSCAVVSDSIAHYITCCLLVLSHQLNQLNCVFTFAVLWKAEGSIWQISSSNGRPPHWVLGQCHYDSSWFLLHVLGFPGSLINSKLAKSN